MGPDSGLDLSGGTLLHWLNEIGYVSITSRSYYEAREGVDA